MGNRSRAIVLCIVAYVGREVYNLWAACAVPLARGDEPSVRSSLDPTEALDFVAVLTTRKRLPSFASLADLNRADTKVLARFPEVRPAWDTEPEPQHVQAELPAGAETQSLNLFTVALRRGRNGTVTPVRVGGQQFSRPVKLLGRQYPTRFLLTDAPRKASDPETVPEVLGVPRTVEIGFLVEERPLSVAGVQRAPSLRRHFNGGVLDLPIFVNTLVSPKDEYADVREANLSVEVRFRNIGLSFYALQQNVIVGLDDAQKIMKVNEYDLDSFRQLASTSLWKVIVVYSVSILHLVFSWLAFKSDLQFWRSKTSFEGMSARSIQLSCLSNIVSFLYVQEQRQSRIALYFVGVRLVLNIWKLSKLTRVVRKATFPYVKWQNIVGASQTIEEFEEIDAAEFRCMRILFTLLLPLVAAFAGYRLIYHEFRSWYSWAILTLAVASQTAGFVIMTPQVFMNYRLKSVEHLPWRALTYQAINTFIDDVFTLCIRMPEVQKYSVFRDDIVFLVCCYQRYIYRARREDAPASNGHANDGEISNGHTSNGHSASSKGEELKKVE
jgi:hypothetical protein